MRAAILALLLATPPVAVADTVTVAVASSFAPPMEALAEAWEAETGHEVRLAPGATGLLHAQIVRGAPFDLFLSADRERPARLEAAGLGLDRHTYARGVLALWSVGGDAGPDALMGPAGRLAIPDPEVAPYGVAAMQAMEALGTEPAALLMGQNASQALLFAVTGNADHALTAASLLRGQGGAVWVVPGDLHDPVDQDAVRLTDAEAAVALHDWLRSEPARAIIREWGFETP